DRPGDRLGVLPVGVGGRQLAPLERLFQYEAQVLERAALPVRVAEHRQRGTGVDGARQRERRGREPGRLVHRPDFRAADPVERPGAVVLARDGDMVRPEHYPGAGEAQRVVQVGVGVELHRILDAQAQFRRQPRGLIGVAGDNLLVERLTFGVHARDRLRVHQRNGLPGLWLHPEGRITYWIPGLLGCGAPLTGVAEDTTPTQPDRGGGAESRVHVSVSPRGSQVKLLRATYRAGRGKGKGRMLG